MKRFDAAISCYEKVVEMSASKDTPPWAFIGLGNAYRGRGDITKAKEFITHAARISPDDSGIASLLDRLQTGSAG